jgi:hypothetical protein
MPGWVHVLELVTAAIAVLFLAVLISAFGWGVLVLAALCSFAAWLAGRRIAQRMRHRHPRGV